jgi:hypothetical protein
VDDRRPGRIRGRDGRRRAPLLPVRRDERRLDRRVEPRGGPLNVFAMATDGSDVQQITRTPQWDSAPDRGAQP